MSYGHHGMTLERFVVMTQDERIAWLKSDEHLFNCIGYSEGVRCCLESLIGVEDAPEREVHPPSPHEFVRNPDVPETCVVCGMIESAVTGGGPYPLYPVTPVHSAR